MSQSILPEELRKIPYLTPGLNMGGRIFHILPYWDGEEWHLWMPSREGKLNHIKLVDAAESLYVTKGIPAKPTDIEVPFISLMWQRAGYKDVHNKVMAITQDFSNMALSLAKIEHIFNTKNSIKNGSSRGFITTDIEYLLVLSRSIFDLLYEILTILWRNTRLLDNGTNAKKKRQGIPARLSKFIFLEGQPRSAQNIVDTYAMPLSLAKTIENCTPFISYVRSARDRIVHSGKSPGIIFETEKGFCINPSDHPFSDFYSEKDISPWKDDKSDLVSLWPWLAYIVLNTINSCNIIVDAFSKVIQLPEEIAPEYKVFVRNPSNHALIRVMEISDRGYPWWDSPL